MFQFTTTTVINSQYAVDYNGNPLKDAQGNNVPKFSTRDALTKLFVAKVGTFNKDNIVSLHKRAYSAAVNSVVAFTVPALTANLVYRLTVKIRLSGAADSDYVNYTTDFRKPVVVEIKATGTAATDASAFAKAFNDLKVRFDLGYVRASAAGAVLTITAVDGHQLFEEILLEKESNSNNSIIMPDYEDVAITLSTNTAGKIGFGDDNWMLRSVALQSYENIRPFGINKEEKPVLGGNYSQYTIRYSIEKDADIGIVSGAKSITTHVFWVKSDLVTAFEALFANTTGLNIAIVTI